MISYQEYLDSPFMRDDITQLEFERLAAYANQSIQFSINRLIPFWKQKDYSVDAKIAIRDANVQQVIYYKDFGLQSSSGGVKRKSESLEGYSITFETDSTVINGMNVVNTAIQTLENAFRADGLMCRCL